MLAIGAIAAVAVAGTIAPNVPLPRAAILAPIAYSVAVLADLATAIILIATWRASSPRRSTVALILSFASSALLLFIAMMVLPLIPTVAPVIGARPLFGAWIFIFWHVLAALGALAYVALRADETSPSVRFTLSASATAILLVGCSIAVALHADRLPILARGNSLAGLTNSGVGPFAVGLMAVAALFMCRIREPGHLDRALTFALMALTAELVVLLAGGHRYTTAYYAGRVLVLAAALFIFVAAMRMLIEAKRGLAGLEWALENVAGESEKRAGRIAAVWQIASQRQGSESDRTRSVLAIAAAALRPGKPMMGFLCRLDGDRIVVEDAAYSGFGEEAIAARHVAFRGASFAAEDTMSYRLRGETRAKAWDDLSTIPRDRLVDGMVMEALEAQSFIGAEICVARKNYFVSFCSPKTMVDEPFAEDDLAYVDVIASFFASRFEQQQQFKQIQFEIEHDGLTGLENRAQLRVTVRDEAAGDSAFALAFVNIDGFRDINSRYGFQFGDEVLIGVAERMLALSERNLVARIGADTFGVLIRYTDSADSVARAVGRYANLFREPMKMIGTNGAQKILIGASIGVARFPSDARSSDDLIRRADVALKLAKTLGGSKTLLFDASMDSILEESRLRFVELADAIAGDQLALAYQPTFELATRRIVGAEALVRWDHPERGRLPPSEFIDFAERNNLIGPLTVWVFQRVLRDLSSRPTWPPGFRIYFNVAAQMLDDIPFITMLDQSLSANAELAAHLGIEVTESAAMQNVERSMNTISLFRRLGVSVAIDDFGTGHSSLSYLKNLVVDVVKIDRSFVAGLSSDDRDNAIVEMMLGITDRFGFVSLAEGIETEEQLAWLLERGCRLGQGYLVAKPHTFEILLDLISMTYAAT